MLFLNATVSQKEEVFASLRSRMVDTQIIGRGVHDPAVIDAMRSVPRHFFVPEISKTDAYNDGPLSIGEGQTISQPYIVASMTELLELTPKSRVLEIGTGSSYQTAVLAEISGIVYTVEFVEKLFQRAKKLLDTLRYDNVNIRLGDGYSGWDDEAPFDAIIVTAAAARIPEPLLKQLAVGGRLVLPLEEESPESQRLVKIVRTPSDYVQEDLYAVRFVPMKGMIADE